MDSLKSAVSGTRSGFDIQNDLNLLDSIGSNIQELDTLRQTDLDARKARIEGT
ncbi:DEKNAAC103379 [Brettanomyces naardenensis]|uniref:DEKNAAC103379 n=1 Tax=Brettanomyces naardenensis TaxID=13370 RepID=A0A448YP33_BRENA|nr:DEKNAAC103379 [Brettanomyces naardenensis]